MRCSRVVQSHTDFLNIVTAILEYLDLTALLEYLELLMPRPGPGWPRFWLFPWNSHILLQKKEMLPCTPQINYHLESKVSIKLRCQLCSTHYTALRIKKCSKSTSVIKVATMKNMNNFCYERKPSHTTTKSTPYAVTKMIGTQRRTLISP